jgi:DNA-binding HxlR family transcriptional regulator
MKDSGKSGCSVETTMQVIGGRWKSVVLYWLLGRTMRFGELARAIPNVTQRMLTLQLRELEADGLVKRTVYPEVPPRVEYTLTAYGKTLEPILVAMRAWGKSYAARVEKTKRDD